MMKVFLMPFFVCFAFLSNAQDSIPNPQDAQGYQQLLFLLTKAASETENSLLKEHFETVMYFAQDTTHGFKPGAEDYKWASESLSYFDSIGLNWETYLNEPRPLMLSFISPSDGLRSYYWLVLPKNYDSTKKDYPLYFELHGSGGGSNNNPRKMIFQPLQPDLKGVATGGSRKEGFWVFPWGRGDKGYRDQAEKDVLEALADFDSRFKTDPTRQYLYGFSMGGMGTLKMYPMTKERWSAIASYSGALRDADLDKAKQFVDVPVWIAWGSEERWADGNQQIRDLFIEAGVKDFEWTEVEGVGHKYLGEYQEKMLDWLNEHEKK